MLKASGRRTGWLAVLFVSALLIQSRPSSAACLGDCNGDGSVTVDELIRGVNIALDAQPLSVCPSLDTNADQAVTVDEILKAVNNAIAGCPMASPTPSPSATRSPTPLSVVIPVSTSPASGEGGVALNRETVVHFSGPLAADSVTRNALFASFGGARFGATVHLSADRQTATLFYAEPFLPPSARVRFTIDGNQLRDAAGRAVDADGDGLPGGVATFDFDTAGVASVPGTAVCGRVFASELAAAPGGESVNRPLAGVTISVDGAEQTMHAVTNAMGDFRLDPAPAGRFFVTIDGRTATAGVPSGAYYPFVGKTWESVAGQETNIGNIFLPLVAAGTLQPVSNTQETPVQFPASVLAQHPELAGTVLMVPPGSLYSESGAPGPKIGIAPVPPDRLPSRPPLGLEFPIVITVQSDFGTNFDTPAPICFPNLPLPETGVPLAAGAESALWSFNHDTGRFEMVGPMHVTANGQLVCTDPGVGVPAPGWHGSRPGVLATGGTIPPGRFCFAVENLDSAHVEQRGSTGRDGVAFDTLVLAAHTNYRIRILEAATLRIGEVTFATPAAGQSITVPPFALGSDTSPDVDNDLLGAISELIVGTDPNNPDTDGDGVRDGPEKQQGTDPLDGRPAATGIIATADTPGTAVDVCAFNEAAAVADADRGVTVFNVFNGMDPIVVAQVDTPGNARRVACGNMRIAIADDTSGLAIVDITDPPAARVTQQIRLGANDPITAVAVGANLAYAGSDGGKLYAVDMLTGAVLAAVSTGGAVHDLRIEGDVLYMLSLGELRAYSVDGGLLLELGKVAVDATGPDSVTGRKRLFVGGGLAYATTFLGFEVFDVSNPAQMRRIAPLTPTGPRGFKQIVANGSGLGVLAASTNFTPDGPHDVWLYDIRTPTDTTRFLTSFATPGLARAVSIFNGLAYTADSESGLEVINYLPFDANGQPPSITLHTNFAQGLAEENQVLRLSADVTDDVQVRNVEFYVDGVKVATDGDFPFEYRFVPARRNFTVRARASDTGGNATFTAEFPIQLVADARPPRITAVSPTSGAITGVIDTVAVFFSETIDNHRFSLTLTDAGPDGQFGTADDHVVTPTGRAIRDEVHGYFLTFATGLPPGRYRAAVPGSVADLAGNPLANPMTWIFGTFNLGSDRDADCLPDSLEPLLGLNPDSPDSNGNGIRDGDEDADGDGLSNCGEVLLGTDPLNPDTDGDGIPDGNEDTDGDGIPDGEEVLPGADGFRTDPRKADSDGDGIDDGAEITLGLNPNDPTDVNHDVVINGKTLALTGHVRLHSLSLTNATVLTHAAATTDTTTRLELTVDTLQIDASSSIDVSGRGFLGGQTAENTDIAGRTQGNAPGSTGRSGGSHGGLGGLGTVSSPNVTADVYGDVRNPDEPGGGGATACGTGDNNGGGVLRIVAGTVQLDGVIAANGASSGSGCGGGGAGGSVRLMVGTLSGSGSIHANGGDTPGGGYGTGGGGGGRIALIYDAANSLPIANVTAVAGVGTSAGGSGTIFVQKRGDPGELIVRGGGRETPLPENFATDNLTIDAATVSVNQTRAATLTLRNGAVLTHPGATANSTATLDVQVGTLTVDVMSSIDVSGRGFLGGQTASNPDATGRTLGNVPGSTGRSGGSHGGLGGLGTVSSSNVTADVYGEVRNPNEPGGGGATACGTGDNNGGGVLRIVAGTVQLDGLMAADGASTGNACGGGGAGGSVKLEVGTLAGSGSIRANGGNAPGGGYGTGGGGGGRIAVIYDSANTLPITKVTAVAGVGTNAGAPGTIFVQKRGDLGELLVRGSGRETPLPEDFASDRLTIDAATVSVHRTKPSMLTLRHAAVLTHGATGTSVSNLDVEVGTLTVDAMSGIDVSGRGLLGGLAGDNTDKTGRTFGNIVGSTGRSGGSHGGPGGTGVVDAPNIPAAVYGDFRDPRTPGGGGATACPPGSNNGGGVARITADAVQLDGYIAADGMSNINACGGGGAGGSVKLEVGTLNGVGSIHANGGNAPGGGYGTGGGGGGRIAVAYVTNDGFDFSRVTVLAGLATTNGGVGTVYLRPQNQALGRLIIDANGQAPGATTPLYSLGGGVATTVTDNQLSDMNAQFVPGQLVGLELNPNLTQAKTFTIIANDTNSISTDPADGDLRSVARPGNAYGAVLAVDRLEVRGLAQAQIVNADAMQTDRRGRLQAATIELAGTALLTHPAATSGTTFGLDLNVSTMLAIDATSRIDASGRGFLGGLTGDNAGTTGRTFGNTIAGGSTGRSGGSHGGLGGLGTVNDPNRSGTVYGDARDPNEPGAGGATACQVGANSGGGVLRIVAGSLQLNGVLAADGSTAATSCGGGGAGGSIRLQVATLSGSGTIRANGGDAPGGGYGTGGGGGGRIAIFYSAADTLPSANVATLPGVGTSAGAAGTIFVQRSGQVGELLVRGSGRETPLPESFTTDHLVIDGAIVAVTQSAPKTLTLRNGAVMTHPGATTTNVPQLHITTDALSVDATSRIDVSGRGFLGGRTAENGDNAGRTQGNTAGSTGRSGGSHGGLGGLGLLDGPNVVADVYGDARDPNEPGGGGAAVCGVGANNGGGVVRIVAGSAQVAGTIAADGFDAASGCAGGGAGGSVKLEVGTLSGVGSIHANGGNAIGGGYGTGGGGGGRIALFFQSTNNLPIANVTAVAGVGTSAGAPGTIFVQQRDALGELLVRGSGRETPLPENFATDHLTIDTATVSVNQTRPATLTLRNGAVLTHAGASVNSTTELDVQVGTLSIDAMSAIDVSGRGFLGGLTLDNGDMSGRTFGNVAGSTGRSGGSHGGRGGRGSVSDPNVPAPVYGDFRDPKTPGGGGATACNSGFNNGGGVVRITADTLQLDGHIAADGASSGNGCSGGGAGGSIKVDVGTLSGTGSMRADGGSVPGGGYGTGGGAGGRVAVVYGSNAGFDFTQITTIGGLATFNGAMGTVYLRPQSQALGTLIIDGNGRDPAAVTPLYSLGSSTSTALAANRLIDATAQFVPGQLVGLELNPNSGQTRTFTVVANDETGISTEAADGDLRSVASAGNPYGAVVAVQALQVRAHAVAEIINGDANRADRRGRLQATTIELADLAWLTHPAATSNSIFGLELNASGALSVDATSRIDVSGRGFLGGLSGENTSNQGFTIGNTSTGGSTGRSGGSHGGLGGVGTVDNPNSVGAAYGDPNDPNEPGAGGAAACQTGASGGGVLRISAGSVALGGLLAADGADSGSGCAGGGAGGSLKVVAGTLSGTGTIHANGGNAPGGGYGTGGGGGGRVAVSATDATGFAPGHISAAAGVGTVSGQSGTVVQH